MRRPLAKSTIEPQKTHLLTLREDLDSIVAHNGSTVTSDANAMEPVAANPINQNSRLRPFDTYPDVFGIWRRYIGLPSQSLDKEVRLVVPVPTVLPPILANSGISEDSSEKENSRIPTRLEAIAPFPSWSAWLLGRWFWTTKTTQKSLEQLDSLINVITDPKFRPQDVYGVNFRRLKEIMGAGAVASEGDEEEEDLNLIHGNGWKRATVTIYLPDGTEADTEKAKRKGKPRRQNNPIETPEPISGK
jgi:hypothetical protein